MKHKIRFILNGEEVEHEVKANRTLLQMLREDFYLTGAKDGCGVGECGACTVLVNNEPITSCLMLGVEVDNKNVVTIEGLSDGKNLHELQTAFIENGALQCGYCTPGMVLSAKSLLEKIPHPTVEEIKTGISGNLCRCTGYKKIIEAIQEVSKRR